MVSKPLENIKVLELASVLAGPGVGLALAELGATVIKVENLSTKGDVTRTWKLPTESADTDISGYFSCVNWGKKSLALDITQADGLDIVYQLVKQCDIVIASYKPGDDAKLKVDYDTLCALNPKLIYAHITGYGRYNNRTGYDAIIQAESGFTYMNGEPDGKPGKMPVALMDLLASHQLKEGILLALWQLEKTGKGAYIETGLFKSGVASLANQATNWLVGNTIPRRMGSDHPNIVPYGTIFYSADNKAVVLAIGSNKQFSQLCQILGIPEVANEPRFIDNLIRVKNRAAITNILVEAIGKVTRDELLGKCQKIGIPAGGVFDMEEVFELPEAKEMLMYGVTSSGHDICGVRSVALNIDGKPVAESISAPPHYGENSLEILKEMLNLPPQIIANLLDKNVVYDRQQHNQKSIR
ncbi:MAG TPA: carnitine dehydratase [Bacteroidales bacterium]|nr:carnitine dehydratase [Bacteroidales bacterium]